jgi:peptidoglycan/LPS O-acetylase OafA/YrhL
MATVDRPGVGPGQERPRHLEAVDVVRVLTVIGVVAVHSISSTSLPSSVPAGAATIVLHVNREVFFLVTAMVLTYSWRSRTLRLGAFYARRYWLVVLPYVAWTLVYFVFDGELGGPAGATLRRLAETLATGSARYHLYFLLVTMQIYLVFPLLLWLVRATRGHHRLLFGGSLAAQLAFTAAVHARVALPGVLGAWASQPDIPLPSYQLYIIAGALAADHLEELTSVARRYPVALILGCLAVLLVAVESYLREVHAGLSPFDASQIFQPVVVVESLAAFGGLFALGVRWADRRRPSPLDRLVSEGSRRSFGVFLAHPLVLQGLLWLGSLSGLLALLQRTPTGVALAVGLAVVVPLVLAASWALVGWALRSPLTLPLTGRPRALAVSGAGRVRRAASGGPWRDPAR